jgi:pimeloyl-ACP methyl ester carboxylesterase
MTHLSHLNHKALLSANYKTLLRLNHKTLLSANYKALLRLNHKTLLSANYKALLRLNCFLTIIILFLCLTTKAQYPPADSSRASWVKQLKQKRTQIPTPPYHYVIENVCFNNNGLTYGATLTKPTGLKSFPTVVLINGTSPQDRDYTCSNHKYFWVLADYLSNHGIAVLRMDDRGMGESTGNYYMATTRDFATDILAGVQWLHTRKDIDTARIGLIGHSEGGIIAPMTYTMSPGSTKFLVLICGPIVGLRYINRFQSRQQFEKTYKSDTLVAAKMRLHGYIVDNIPAHAHDTGEMHQLLRHAADTFYATESPVISEKLRIKNNENTVVDLNRSYKAFLKPWWQYILDYNPLTDIHQLQCPVLGIFGEKDQQVPPVEDYNLLKANLPPNRFSEVIMMKNMSHFMQPDTADGSWDNYEKIETTIMPELLDKIANWINILPK